MVLSYSASIRSWGKRCKDTASALEDFFVWSPWIITIQYDGCCSVYGFWEPRRRSDLSCLGNPRRIQKKQMVNRASEDDFK